MAKLSRDHYISQPLFSIYVSLKPGNTSFINFGGWDKDAVLKDSTLVTIMTATKDSYSLKFRDVIFAGQDTGVTVTAQTVIFDPSSRYIKVPAT